MTATALGTQTAVGVGSGGTIGAAPVACDNTNGNSIHQDGNTVLRFSSSPGGTVVFPYPVKVDGGTVASKTVTVPASGIVWVVPGVPDAGLYPGGLITFTASAATVFVEVVNHS